MQRLPAIFSRPGEGKRYRGQGMVEFALILPLILLVIFVIIELARLLAAYLSVENGARFGVRYGATGEFDEAQYCAGFPGGVCDDRSEEDYARVESIRDAAEAGAVALLRDSTALPADPGFFKITVCSSLDSTPPLAPGDFNLHNPVLGPPLIPAWCEDRSSGAEVSHPGSPGDYVYVTVEFNHPLIVPLLSTIWPQLHVWARRQGIVEMFRTARILNVPNPVALDSWTPTMTQSPTLTLSPTVTPTPTDTSTPTQTFTPSDTPTITQTYTPSNTRTPSNTPTISPTPTITLTPSRTYTPTITRTPTNTFTPSRTPTPSNTPTRSNTPTITYTRTPSRTPTDTGTPTDTFTPSITPTPSNTRTPSRTPTPGPTRTPTPTRSPTATNTTVCGDC